MVLLCEVDSEGFCFAFVFDFLESFVALDGHSDAADEEDGAGDEFVAPFDDGVDGDDEEGDSCEGEGGAECELCEFGDGVEHWCLPVRNPFPLPYALTLLAVLV